MPFHLLRLYHTAARGTCTAQGSINHGRSTPHARTYLQGFGRTVFNASATFHAGISIFNPNLAVVLNEYGVRANVHAGPATVTLLSIEG